jgi:hypothetical protein
MALPPAGKLLSRRELQHACKGLTDMQRLFSFGKFSGLNDKDSAIAVGYSVSVAENTKLENLGTTERETTEWKIRKSTTSTSTGRRTGGASPEFRS